MAQTPVSATDPITLLIGGMIYQGWTEMTVSRAIDRLKSVFTLTVTDFAVGGAAALYVAVNAFQIAPFTPCVIKIGNDTVMTGYVTEYAADFDGRHHSVTVQGASKTCDLVDCTPDISGGQYKGYTLEQVARALCGLFSIGVVVQTDATQIFPDVTLQRGETAFTFLERLGRLAGVLLTDDAYGNLVLCTCGTTRASGVLVQGQNILAANGRLNVEKQFSQYIVKGQAALGSTLPNSPSPPAPVQNALRAVSLDTSVPRYRPKVSIAEAQLDQAGMQRRADWERNYGAGRAAQADITVPGWRQPDGTLWQTNTLVSCTAPALQMEQDMLIAETTFMISKTQQRTRLRVGPPSGFTPDPGQVKLHVKKGKAGKGGKGGSAPNWSGAGGAA